MQMQPVTSSSIAAIGYDAAHRELHVRFKHGGLYAYADVAPHAVAELMAADSIGGYFAANIRNSYNFTKLS